MQLEGFSVHEQEVFDRYHARMQRLGAQFLGLETIPVMPIRHLIEGVVWEISKHAEMGESPVLSPAYTATLNALQTEHIPFILCSGIAIENASGYHLIDDGGALQSPPSTASHVDLDREPLCIAIIPVSTEKGLWYRLPEK